MKFNLKGQMKNYERNPKIKHKIIMLNYISLNFKQLLLLII